MTTTNLILYGTEISAPVRAVMLTLKALNLDYEFRHIDLAAGDNLKDNYIKLNPQHTVPTLRDGDFIIWDSHAICSYIVRKYAKDDILYPKDFQKRALVDQRLHYESEILFACMKRIAKLIFENNVTEIPSKEIDQIHKTYAMLEIFLSDHAYLVGDELTIADFSIIATVSAYNGAFTAIEKAKYPKLSAWKARIEALPYYNEICTKGLTEFEAFIKSKCPKQFDKLWRKAFADIKLSKQ